MTAAPAPYGWSATTPAGLTSLYIGAQPPAGSTNVTALATQADYEAALQALRFPPPPAPTLVQVQASQIATLTAACNAAIVGGYSSSALGTAHIYPSDATSQMNMTSSVVASLVPGLPTDWATIFWCEDSSGAWAMRPHTAAQIQKAGQDGMASIVAAQTKLATLTTEVNAATTIAAVQAIAWA